MARPRKTVSGNRAEVVTASAASVFHQRKPRTQNNDPGQLAQPWQIEAYRHVGICGEARYSVALFSALAGRAEIGISEPQVRVGRVQWVDDGPEVEAFAEVARTVRDRSKLIRDYMTHRIIAGECYLIARDRVETDPGYDDPTLRRTPLWEVVAVTEVQYLGGTWSVRHANGVMIPLKDDEPIIRIWTPDPTDRHKAWSPFKALLPVLEEIEWLTKHIFTQIQSRLGSAGVLFLPDNLTFPDPPADAVNGGQEAIAAMSDAEKFMTSLADASMSLLESDEVALPTIVMAPPEALANVDQSKLIQFWSEIDDKAMLLRSAAVQRFALGMDMPPEQILGSSGVAVAGSGGSAGSVNHWGEWAKEEQTIKAHIEPALDDLCGALTMSFLISAVSGTDKVIGYDTANLRGRQDRSKEAIELYDRGVLNARTLLRETGFDPEADVMDDAEYKRWLLNRVASGSSTPEQLSDALAQLGVKVSSPEEAAETTKEQPGRNQPRSLDDHPYEGPPRGDHDHNDAAYAAMIAAAEVLSLRALEKFGAKTLNASARRGKERDTKTPAHLVHVMRRVEAQVKPSEFDFGLASQVLTGMGALQMEALINDLGRYCADLVNKSRPHSREALEEALA